MKTASSSLTFANGQAAVVWGLCAGSIWALERRHCPTPVLRARLGWPTQSRHMHAASDRISGRWWVWLCRWRCSHITPSRRSNRWRASSLRQRSAAHEPSVERPPVPLKPESKSSSTYRSRADEAAAASVTPARAIRCARAVLRAPACAAQAREQEQQHVLKPSRRSRGRWRQSQRWPRAGRRRSSRWSKRRPKAVEVRTR